MTKDEFVRKYHFVLVRQESSFEVYKRTAKVAPERRYFSNMTKDYLAIPGVKHKEDLNFADPMIVWVRFWAGPA